MGLNNQHCCSSRHSLMQQSSYNCGGQFCAADATSGFGAHPPGAWALGKGFGWPYPIARDGIAIRRNSTSLMWEQHCEAGRSTTPLSMAQIHTAGSGYQYPHTNWHTQSTFHTLSSAPKLKQFNQYYN